ncbi:hypothetical protein ACFUVU_09590 [Streptomyces griseoincarnatus]
MPFDSLLFFGDNGGGDQFALVVAQERDDVFVWDHETGSRMWAGSPGGSTSICGALSHRTGTRAATGGGIRYAVADSRTGYFP